MPSFLILVKYSAQGAAGARADGYATRQAEGTKAFESLGATIDHWMWLDWSDYDFAFVATAPSHDVLTAIGAHSMASGAFAKIWVSPTYDSSTMDALASGGLTWRAPGT